MTAKRILLIVVLLALCFTPIKDSIASPIVKNEYIQIETPENEVSTGIAPLSELPSSDISSLSGSKVTFDPSAGGSTCYHPGMPQTLCFQSETFTSDWEYLYNNWIKFPSDWIVSDVYVQGTPVCDSGSWGAFSWSFETSPYEVNIAQARFHAPTDHCVATYCVDLTPSGIADPAEVSWFFDGDGYNAAPHNPCSDDGYTPAGQDACDEMINPAAAVPICELVPQVVLTPEEIVTSGCRGEPQFHILTIMNLTGAESTFDITYNKNFPGDISGPDQITLANGATTDFDVILDPHLCTANAGYTATVTVSDGTYSDQSTLFYEIYYEINEWQSIQTSPIGRMDNVLAAHNGKVWSIAGYGASGDVNYYDPNSNSWTTLPASAPPWGTVSIYPRSGCQMGDEVFIYGDSQGSYTGLWSYNLNTNIWTQETPTGTAPPYTGIWAPSWVADPSTGLCYLTGGASTAGAGNLNSVYVYDKNANAWLVPLPTFNNARDFHAAFLFNRPSDSHKLLCVAGGNNGAQISSTQCFDFSVGAWNTENADLGTLPGGLWGMGYTQRRASDGEQLWMVGGVYNDLIVNQTWFYDVNTGTWMDGGLLESVPVYRTAAVTLDQTVYHMGGSTVSLSYTGFSNKQLDIVCPECIVPDMTKEATEIALPGQTIHYTISIDPMVSDSVLITDALPASVDYIPGSFSVTPHIGSADYDPVTHTITWWYNPGQHAINTWKPAEKTGTSSTTDITTQGAAPSVLAQTESLDYTIDSVLWDQPLSSVFQDGYINQDFPEMPDLSFYLADDFLVTVPWLIDTFFVPGDGFNGFSTLLNATSLTFMIYGDNNGVPTGDPSGAGALPFWSLALLPTDPHITITNGSRGLPSNTQLALDEPLLLPPGHYWFVFYPTMTVADGGQYGRQVADTTNLHSARLINPGGGFAMGTEWQSWMYIFGFEPDLAFRIEGIEIPNLQIEFDATVNAPLNQIITNDVFLEYGSYISQANDQTFTGYGTYLPILTK